MTSPIPTIGRRSAMVMLGAALLAPASLASLQAAGAGTVAGRVHVWRSPSCGCCGLWVAHLKREGFEVDMTEIRELAAIKSRLGVPSDLASCHTAEIGTYVIEGHVPAHAIRRLLAEKPKARGLAVPGMPIGSPGMEGGTPEAFDVVLFGPDFRRSYGRYLGSLPV